MRYIEYTANIPRLSFPNFAILAPFASYDVVVVVAFSAVPLNTHTQVCCNWAGFSKYNARI